MIELVKKMTIALLALLTFLASDLLARQDGNPYRTETFQTSSSPEVQVRTSGGSIHLSGHDNDEVRVLMYVQRRGEYLSPSDTDLNDFEITIEQRGNEVIAEARRNDNGRIWSRIGNSNISISFMVYLPVESSTNGTTSGGSVRAENISNSLSLRTSGGSVNASNIHGTAELRTSGGSMSLENMSGTISARTNGGTIRAQDISGDAELSTSGGSIRLDDISAKLSARTSGGSINASFTAFNDDIELRTSGGSIFISIPSTENFNIDLSGSRLNIELRNFTGDTDRRHIRGRIGSGGPTIKASTSGGSVQLRY